MKKGPYTYYKVKFCIPVTKAEPLDSIQFIIDDFKRKKVTFCLEEKDNLWEIWRIEEETDNDKIKKDGMPEHPKKLFVDGLEVDNFLVF